VRKELTAFEVDVKTIYSRLNSYRNFSELMGSQSRRECDEAKEKVRCLNQKLDAIAESLGVYVIDDEISGEIKFAATGPRAAVSKKSAEATLELNQIRKLRRQADSVLADLRRKLEVK
jgi:predicted methyltransferase